MKKSTNQHRNFIMMRWVDYCLIILLFSFSIFLLIYLPIYFGNESGSTVVVNARGETYGVYDLYENQVIEVNINGHINVIEIKDGVVNMIDANCNDKVCITHGTLDKTYDSIVCLPNQVIVKIITTKSENIEEEEDEIDSISS